MTNTDIIFVGINAKWIHPNFALRCLAANLKDLKAKSLVLEFTLKDKPEDIIASILSLSPKIIAFSVYLWNHEIILSLSKELKARASQVCLIAGGPEITYISDHSSLIQFLDYFIAGEGESAVYELCHKILQGELPDTKKIIATLPVLETLASPYELYTSEDLLHKLTYVEASRGCPYSCQFCLSSLDAQVRFFPLEAFLKEMKKLFERGCRSFKFLDRTFNLDIPRAKTILAFFSANLKAPAYVHFEMVPDRFPKELQECLKSFSPGTLRLEIGIQTFNQEVAKRISRVLNLKTLDENLIFLREETQAIIHVDLIAGLPGEDWNSFAKGFDHLWEVLGGGWNIRNEKREIEIQLGILKNLPGTSLSKHDQEFQLNWNTSPPYNILSTSVLTEVELIRLNRIAKYWDLFVGRGRFVPEIKKLFPPQNGTFQKFSDFSDFVWKQTLRTWGISLELQKHLMAEYIDLIFQTESISKV